MAYEYEEAIRGSVEMELFRHGHHNFEYDAEVINEIKEVYAKAKAFDEILNVDYIVAPDDYAHEVTKIVDKYMEDK